MRRPHTHACDNHRRGCGARIACDGRGILEAAGSPRVCEYEDGPWECEDCLDAPACPECGVFDHLLEAHWGGCPFNPLERDDSLEAKFMVEGESDASKGVA